MISWMRRAEPRLPRSRRPRYCSRTKAPPTPAEQDRDDAPWCYDLESLLRRLLALVLVARGDTAAAEAELRAAIACARSHESRSLELRAGIALAELLRGSGRAGEARAIVTSVYGAFEEGHETPDLRAAAALLELDPQPGARAH
jgi:hypothetical protein